MVCGGGHLERDSLGRFYENVTPGNACPKTIDLTSMHCQTHFYVDFDHFKHALRGVTSPKTVDFVSTFVAPVCVTAGGPHDVPIIGLACLISRFASGFDAQLCRFFYSVPTQEVWKPALRKVIEARYISVIFGLPRR